jgi:hypothetical protein
MSLATIFPHAILDTILGRLAPLFSTGAAGDTANAHQAAAQMLASYHPETHDELRLAANIIGFSLHALEALSQAAAPDMNLTRVLRLRGGAVSLSRAAEKAQRRLDQLQKARRQGIQPEAHSQPEPTQPPRQIEQAIDLIQDTADIRASAKATGLTWTQSYEQRQTDLRIAARLQRAERRVAARAATAASPRLAGHQGLADRAMAQPM